jgi:penicillin amidase
MALQNDNHDPLAGSLIAQLSALSSKDLLVSRCLDLLRSWDLNESEDSTAAAIYQVWANNYLSPMTVKRVTPDSVHELFADGSLAAVIGYLAHPDGRLGPDPRAARDALLIDSLGAAVEHLKAQFGPDISAWRWGKLHQLTFRPAIAALAEPALRDQLTLFALELGGSGDSPHAAAFDPPQFAVVAGASVRVVLDVGDWDRSMAINAPGQSGDFRSSHYADLLQQWAQGHYVPLLYTRAAIERAAEQTLDLRP